MFQAKATAEFARLRRVQAELEVETGQLAFVGLSVVGTIRQAVRHSCCAICLWLPSQGCETKVHWVCARLLLQQSQRRQE